MGEATIDPKLLEDAMLKALPTLFPHLVGTTNDPPVEFYDKFQREADERDNDFVKKYGEDLDITLIFAGLFSAVASAFIFDVESQLQPDFTQSSYIVLTIIANISLGHPPADLNSVLPQWNGPDPTLVQVEAILYTSLAASLLAAFVAMLGKQWLNRYTQVEKRGNIVERGRQRQRKINGMATWRFDLVMESLPLMLQAALLLFGYALSSYLYTLNHVIAGVAIGFTAFGLLFYLLIVSAATLSYNCPFQTPLSLVIRLMIRFDDEHEMYLKRTRKWLGRTFAFPNLRKPWLGSADPNAGADDGHIELAVVGTADEPAPLFFYEKIDWDGYVLDTNCIDWMFETFDTPMDTDVLPIIGFIPEVIWHADIRSTPLARVYITFFRCIDFSTRGFPVLKPGSKNKAYLTAKALLHLIIQRKCMGYGSEKSRIEDISYWFGTFQMEWFKGDSDLLSTLGILFYVFGCPVPMNWKTFSFSIPHHTWMARILLYRTWDVLRQGNPLPDEVKEFVLYSLRLVPHPPVPVVTDCLFIISLGLGIGLHSDDLAVVDKSRERFYQVARIYQKLLETFSNPTPTAEEISRALETLEFFAFLSEGDTAGNSHQIFIGVIQAPLSEAYTQEKKWEASRLVMRHTYKWDDLPRLLEDPKEVLAFLVHYFDLATRSGGGDDESIQNALHTLTYASGPDAIEALDRFDPTEPSFIRGICYVFQDGRSNQLREAALLFLPLIGNRWFNTAEPIMGPDQMRSLCEDWASVADAIEHTPDVQRATLAVLFDMINSLHWRPHIVTENWKLLEYFTSVPDDSQPLKRCLQNPELMDAISQVDNPVAMFFWLEILWLEYSELTLEVRERLEEATKEVSQGAKRTDLDVYLSVIDSESEKAEGALAEYDTEFFVDPAAAKLKAKVGNLQQARAALLVLKEANVVSV